MDISVVEMLKKFEEIGAVLMEKIVKTGLPGKTPVILEFWKTEYGEAILEIRGTKCRVFNLVENEEI